MQQQSMDDTEDVAAHAAAAAAAAAAASQQVAAVVASAEAELAAAAAVPVDLLLYMTVLACLVTCSAAGCWHQCMLKSLGHKFQLPQPRECWWLHYLQPDFRWELLILLQHGEL